MTILPVPSSAALAWRLHDYKQLAAESGPAADGVMRVELPQLPQDELWLVHRIVVQSDSTTDTQARIYLDRPDPGRLVDGTRAGNFDVADMASPIQIPGSSVLVCEWSGASVGAIGAMHVQAIVLTRGN